MPKLSGPRRLAIALSGAWAIGIITTYFVVYLVTMDGLMDERGPGVVLDDDAFRAVWEQAASEARWAGIASVVLIIFVTLVAAIITFVARWVLRGYRTQ